jgi:hypothetical protein
MESIMESIPSSLRGDLSKKLIGIVTGSQDKNAIPTELAKKIIYLWRRDQLAAPVGLMALLEGAEMVDTKETHNVLDELGLSLVAVHLRSQ